MALDRQAQFLEHPGQGHDPARAWTGHRAVVDDDTSNRSSSGSPISSLAPRRCR
ncbi:unnamed protein product [Dovyalis caffra]|uniref:Uncharacterized protein n=1 Tax=Dovyalis caffra TaxID=77055 RepID=A0AAV1QRW5_9ROSI|nr:unnamed protein product [Dovyalis caffra]